ncbi:2-amino-4-hydroxy-6-hydroxymethyldihydropteridine diphosphokinase [Bacillus shivajii]|uniref:2-amino-4-hydroxy-6- hydroxymethyldihydropteridine diphosphokinase n=1 Tax=Bacillus shivajii TaxID=1983719 RepID=UPI001CFB9346|nr:2-amino-4-hydroxy-6-hydroxymethyldihydropteridine diphosphokinase [Bacillus shivajii]UCZ53335.1 2-amino-4-hydroxy-6-hydroxymethyldihydropteridine diphosphokinase [Bacillus shivajii]
MFSNNMHANAFSNVSYLSLGSNIEDRYDHLMEAVSLLKTDENMKVVSTSSIYETAPVGYTDQASFLNMVIKIITTYTPEQLLDKLEEVERQGGRKRVMKWGPRTIDLDILLYNKENINLEHLQIPHPRMFSRGFVLIPLKEIENDITFSTGKTIDDYIDELPDKEGVHVWKSLSGGEESGPIEN